MSRNIGQKIIKYLDAYKKIQPLPNRIPRENTEFKRFVSENCKKPRGTHETQPPTHENPRKNDTSRKCNTSSYTFQERFHCYLR
jgi:hypothetical protein